MPANLPFVVRSNKSLLGTVTRSEAWHSLEKSGHAKDTSCISKRDSSDAERLTAKFAAIERSEWTEEADMYPDIIELIESTLYSSPPPAINVVDTSKLRDFPADVSIADYRDERVPYGMRYFIELKWPKGNLISAENCGQMLDYFDIAHERQPHRLAFAAILSNFDVAFVFEADYRGDSVTIYRKAAPTLADAIIYVDQLSREQYQPIPPIHDLLSSNYSFIDNSMHHVLLSVPFPTSGSTGMQTKSKKLAREMSWRDPSRFLRGDKRFVLKMARGDLDVSNEIRILEVIKDAQCVHLPELVWSPAGYKELGIVPLGQPIDFQQPANMARRVVEGMVDGLQYLHSQGIIHRDIRPSNLIVHYMDVVIVDFETSVLADSSEEVIYEGGHICWPKRLLESNVELYIPEPADDLFACILVVLHLLFPSRFNMFHQGSISNRMPRTRETTKLLQLWNDIEKSKIWGPFVKAARTEKYDNLKGMADVFYSV
jgi:Protein kinase domain